MDEKIKMYISDNTLNIAATNIKEFEDLIEKAKKQACDLNNTIHKLEWFHIKFQLDIVKDQGYCPLLPQFPIAQKSNEQLGQ